MVRRVTPTEIRQFSEIYTFLQPGALLDGSCGDRVYASNWARASADSFISAEMAVPPRFDEKAPAP
jgi:hypothetical protein